MSASHTLRGTSFLALGICLYLAVCMPLLASADDSAAPPPPSVNAGWANTGSSITINGRIFAGMLATEKNGSYPNNTVAIPDMKLYTTYKPNKDLTVVTRLNGNYAGVNPSNNSVNLTFDYFYVDINNWAGVLPGQTIRVGKWFNDFGEEIYTNNPEESVILTNSISNVNGTDGQVDFRGNIPFVRDHPLRYSLSVLNDSGNVQTAQHSMATDAKLGFALHKNLYFSISGLNTGVIEGTGASSGVKIAGLNVNPAGAKSTAPWQRQAVEVDMRVNYGPDGDRPDIPDVSDTLPRLQFAAAAGKFCDHVFTDNAAGYTGEYGYVEGLFNVTPKVYLACRDSAARLGAGELADLGSADSYSNSSPVAVNEYDRLGIGLGYRLSKLIHFKAEYTINKTFGGTTSPKLNQFAIGMASKF